MAGIPHEDPKDYGTVSGQSSGFRKDELSRQQQKIGNGIQAIISQTHTVQRLMGQVGTSSDSTDLRTRLHAAMKSAVTKTHNTKTALQDLMQGLHLPEQRLLCQPLARNLEQAGNDCSRTAQQLKSKLEEFPQPPAQPSISTGHLDSAELEVDGDHAHLIRSPTEQSEQILKLTSETDNILEQEKTMHGLEQDIVGLHDIIGDLGNMLVVQGDNIDNIEAHVEEASNEVTYANKQLGKAVSYKKCSRKLCCIIATILTIVFLIILVIIIIVVAIFHNK